jgi:hypothetical protein
LCKPGTVGGEGVGSRWGWRRIIERILADIAMALMGVLVAALFCFTR